MAKSTLRDRMIVVNWLRNNRLFIKSKEEIGGLEDLKLGELEASLEYCLLWKRHISEMYDAIFAESKFKDEVRYFYRKSKERIFRDGEPEFKEVGFWEDKELKSLSETNSEMNHTYGFFDNCFKDKYLAIKVNRRKLRFTPTEKHLDMLKRMDEINNLSKQAVKMLSTLREQISDRKAIVELENKRRMEELKKAEVKPEVNNGNEENRLSPKECC